MGDDPDKVTWRDLLAAVQEIDRKISMHTQATERRLSRLEKALIIITGIAVWHPSLPSLSLHGVPFIDGAVRTIF